MKACTGMAVWLQSFLNSVPAGGEWSASHYGSFTPGEGCPSVCSGGGCEQTKAHLDALVKKNLSSLCGKSNHDFLVVQPAACSLYWLSYLFPFLRVAVFFGKSHERHVSYRGNITNMLKAKQTCYREGSVSNSGQDCGYPEINFYNSSKKREGSALFWTPLFNSLLSYVYWTVHHRDNWRIRNSVRAAGSSPDTTPA